MLNQYTRNALTDRPADVGISTGNGMLRSSQIKNKYGEVIGFIPAGASTVDVIEDEGGGHLRGSGGMLQVTYNMSNGDSISGYVNRADVDY